MIVICVSTSKNSGHKQVDRVQITLHQSELEAHAVGEAYQAFTKVNPQLNPPVINPHVIPPELVVLEYHKLKEVEGFADWENAVLKDVEQGTDEAEPGGDFAVFGLVLPDDDDVKINEDALKRLRDFFMRNPGSALG